MADAASEETALAHLADLEAAAASEEPFMADVRAAKVANYRARRASIKHRKQEWANLAPDNITETKRLLPVAVARIGIWFNRVADMELKAMRAKITVPEFNAKWLWEATVVKNMHIEPNVGPVGPQEEAIALQVVAALREWCNQEGVHNQLTHSRFYEPGNMLNEYDRIRIQPDLCKKWVFHAVYSGKHLSHDDRMRLLQKIPWFLTCASVGGPY